MAKINLGHVIGPQGPEGPQGPQGPKGDGVETLNNEFASTIVQAIEIADQINGENI